MFSSPCWAGRKDRNGVSFSPYLLECRFVLLSKAGKGLFSRETCVSSLPIHWCPCGICRSFRQRLASKLTAWTVSASSTRTSSFFGPKNAFDHKRMCAEFLAFVQKLTLTAGTCDTWTHTSLRTRLSSSIMHGNSCCPCPFFAYKLAALIVKRNVT